MEIEVDAFAGDGVGQAAGRHVPWGHAGAEVDGGDVEELDAKGGEEDDAEFEGFGRRGRHVDLGVM